MADNYPLPDTLPNQPPLFNHKASVTFTPKNSNKKSARKKSKTRTNSVSCADASPATPTTTSRSQSTTPTSKNPITPTQNFGESISIKFARSTPSTPKKRKFQQGKVINNYYGLDFSKLNLKKVEKGVQTPKIGLDLQVKRNQRKSSAFQYYKKENVAREPGFYYAKLRDDFLELDRLFDALLETGSIMDDEFDVKNKLKETFNGAHYGSDQEFINNLLDPKSFEFISWTHFLANQDKNICSAKNLFEKIRNHDLTTKFREKFFGVDQIDAFLID